MKNLKTGRTINGEKKRWQRACSTDPIGDGSKLKEYTIRQICKYSTDWRALRDKIDEYLETCGETEPLIKAACKVAGVTQSEIMDKCNKQKVVLARDLIWYVMYHLNDISLMKISQIFGKHHTTVIASMKRIKNYEDVSDDDWLSAKSYFFQEIDNIKRPEEL
jgi:chromosomal replication initiation ATPase DnaA